MPVYYIFTHGRLPLWGFRAPTSTCTPVPACIMHAKRVIKSNPLLYTTYSMMSPESGSTGLLPGAESTLKLTPGTLIPNGSVCESLTVRGSAPFLCHGRDRRHFDDRGVLDRYLSGSNRPQPNDVTPPPSIPPLLPPPPFHPNKLESRTFKGPAQATKPDLGWIPLIR